MIPAEAIRSASPTLSNQFSGLYVVVSMRQKLHHLKKIIFWLA
jgi:hypothetical protein